MPKSAHNRSVKLRHGSAQYILDILPLPDWSASTVIKDPGGPFMADGNSVHRKRPTLKELCEQASVEAEPEKLVAMAEEICRRIAAGERVPQKKRLRASAIQ